MANFQNGQIWNFFFPKCSPGLYELDGIGFEVLFAIMKPPGALKFEKSDFFQFLMDFFEKCKFWRNLIRNFWFFSSNLLVRLWASCRNNRICAAYIGLASRGVQSWKKWFFGVHFWVCLHFLKNGSVFGSEILHSILESGSKQVCKISARSMDWLAQNPVLLPSIQ